MKTLLNFLIVYSLLTIVPLYQISSLSAYTLTPSQSIKDGQFLISKSETFILGFFSPSNSSKARYLGVWYKTIPEQTVVWVANRDSPLNDTSGVLLVSRMGNLVIQNITNHVIWSTNTSKIAENPVVEFLESGNLVLRDIDSDGYLWQSFDHPSNTLLPGMKLGWNLKTGFNTSLTSWKNFDDPSTGDYTRGFDLNGGYPEVFMRYGSKKYYRSGPWNGIGFSGAPDLYVNPFFTYNFIQNENEVAYIFHLVNHSVISRFVLMQSGTDGYMEFLVWVDQSNSWVFQVKIPRDRCDSYALCGANSTCYVNDLPVCKCLKGFKARSPKDWNQMNWSRGCERVTPLDCDKGDGFLKLTEVKLPDTTSTWSNRNMNLEECREKCLKNCSCMAYTNTDIRGYGNGCAMWFGDLIDIKKWYGAGQDLYIRMAASELVSITVAAAMLVLGCLAYYYISKKKMGQQFCIYIQPNGESHPKEDLELPLFDLLTVATATDNFSEENKLGEGGFGPVFKGQLVDGQEIAAKRLSKISTQGLNEFKNEVILISKLQHRNLVRLLGCCIQSEEKMLIYEYMPNRSLDCFIFDKMTRRLLDWQKKFQIIMGIARGLLYLHHDSRLRIIHRDLKASNILLDGNMDPKISDFGMARLFGGDQIEANTSKVVGTHGYMSPEYAVDGHFSVKSDVFSFGVLVLEILSGKKNRGFYHADHRLNLLGHAWRLWSEDKAMDLVDEPIGDAFMVQEVLRCIHTGLLCVQQSTQQRPTMSSVVLMLSSDNIELSQPQTPGFYIERSPKNSNASFSEDQSLMSNDTSITQLEGR